MDLLYEIETFVVSLIMQAFWIFNFSLLYSLIRKIKLEGSSESYGSLYFSLWLQQYLSFLILICKIILSAKCRGWEHRKKKYYICHVLNVWAIPRGYSGLFLILSMTLWDLTLTLQTFIFRTSKATTENWLPPRLGLRGVLKSLHLPHPAGARTRTFSTLETGAGVKGEEQLVPFLFLFCP